MPAIDSVARRFPTGAGVERQDLRQEGVVGLLFAVQRYDLGQHRRFWAYASFWVRKSMQELVAELTRPVVLSDRAIRSLAQIRAAQSALVQAHGVEPTNGQLSSATGLTVEQIERLQATERLPRAFEEPLPTEDNAGATIGDAITDPVAEEAFEQVLQNVEMSEVRTVAEHLTEREQAVIRAHYGLDQPAQTLDQIGETLGLTAERARQIEAGALKRMRKALSRRARLTKRGFESCLVVESWLAAYAEVFRPLI
jgi:RNA polymerase primary sigma factor